MDKRKKQLRKAQIRQILARRRSLFVTVGIFIATLVCMVLLWVRYESRPGGVSVDAGSWLNFIKMYMYLGPVLLACVMGYVFRPFWLNFRDALVTVFLVYGLFSLFMYSARALFLMDQKRKIVHTRFIRLKVQDWKKKGLDSDSNGRIDRIRYYFIIDTRFLPEGIYQFSLHPSRSETPLAEEARSERLVFTRDAGHDVPLKFQIELDLAPLEPFLEKGPVDLSLGMSRILPLEEAGRRILELNRWSPLIRYTDWHSRDPDVSEKVLEADRIHRFDVLESPDREDVRR